MPEVLYCKHCDQPAMHDEGVYWRCHACGRRYMNSSYVFDKIMARVKAQKAQMPDNETYDPDDKTYTLKLRYVVDDDDEL